MPVYVTIFPPPLAIARQFNVWAGGIENLREPLEQSVKFMNRQIHSTFQSKGARDGMPAWAPSAEATKERREKEGFPREPVMDRRRGAVGLAARASAMTRWSIRGREGIAEYTNLPNDNWYGILHQFGPERFNVRFPARPFLFITARDEEQIERIFDDWFVRKGALLLR